jgi:hypothetical protein
MAFMRAADLEREANSALARGGNLNVTGADQHLRRPLGLAGKASDLRQPGEVIQSATTQEQTLAEPSSLPSTRVRMPMTLERTTEVR